MLGAAAILLPYGLTAAAGGANNRCWCRVPLVPSGALVLLLQIA